MTIGVNDIQRHFTADHLLIMDNRSVFNPERQNALDNPRFHDTLWWRHGAPLWSAWEDKDLHIRRYRIRRYKDPDDIAEALRSTGARQTLPHQSTTVYTACSLAVILGATWIGVIGLDLIGHHLARRLDRINRAFACLKIAMDKIGVTMVNLSTTSLITSIPYGRT